MMTTTDLTGMWNDLRNAANTWDKGQVLASAEIAVEMIEAGQDANFWALGLEYLRAAAGFRFCGWVADEAPAAPIQTAMVAPVVKPHAAPLLTGFYTVEFEGGEYVTLRVSEDFRDQPDPNCRVVGFLSGPSNTSDYTGFAFVVGGQVRTWKKFAGKPGRQHAAVAKLLGADDLGEYGRAFARQSGNCWKCGRTLTTPESLAAGIGPICAGML